MGPERSATPFYTCTFPGCPSPVNVSIPLVASMQDLVRQTDGDLQGVLYGTRTSTGTEVRNCRPVAAFSPEAMGRAAADREVVGYYRVRRADTMRLTEIEAAIADTSFAKPGSVVLLVQRREGGAQANFFFREAGALVNLSLLMFPLDAAVLDRRQAAVPALSAPAETASAKRRSWGPLVAGMLIAMTGLGAAGWYVNQRRAAAETAAVPVATSSLPLRAERQGADLKVMWDLDSATIAHAVSGVLDIDDGGTKRRIPLDQKQVRFGSVLYTPRSDEVSIDFTAVKEDGSAGQASVLVLLTRTATGAGPDVKNLPSLSASARAADRHLLPPSRPFVAPSPEPVAAAPHEPDNLPAAQMATQPVASVRLPAVSAPAPPPPAASQVVNPPPQRVEAPAPAPPKQVAPSAPPAAYVGPELVSQVGARVPPELRNFLTRPITVIVRATIDENGRVIHTESAQQKVIHVGFLAAATEAAARCVFRPARRGNTPVRGEAMLTFHFNPR